MRWQYATYKIKTEGVLGGIVDDRALEKHLDAFGAEGWELVSIFDTNRVEGATRNVVAVFKRPLADAAE